jgi:aryl-alcohol dehydrogenase-like predicted oxidoreductase
MEYRPLGRTGLQVSSLGFGCGNVGGLMVRGTPAERERAVARAVELGINYFDTAPSYGDGQSELHLGQVLRALKPQVYVGTKFRLEADDLKDVARAVAHSLETSLGRLGLERVDLLQLHNPISAKPQPGGLEPQRVLGEVLPALQELRRQGKIRFLGMTAIGDTPAVHQVIDSGLIDTAQVCYNLLNPSAGMPVPPRFPAQDFDRLLTHTRAQRMGVIVIRVLAAGALSGVADRHPIAVPKVAPIATGPDYGADVARAQRLSELVKAGHAASLVEASLRFAVGHPAVSTVLLGYSSLDQLELAASAVAKGPLPEAALQRLSGLWRELASA